MIKMSFSMPTLTGRNFILAPFREGDVSKQYQDWLMDPEVTRFLDVRNADRSMEALRAYVREKEAASTEYFFLITAKDSGKKVGTIKLSVNADVNVAYFGYLIGDKSYWGGSAARQIQAILFDFAFLELKTHHLMGGVYASNTASHFNSRRMGFRKEAVLRNSMIYDSANPTDIVLYGMLREEWETQKIIFDNLKSQPPRTQNDKKKNSQLIVDTENLTPMEAVGIIIEHFQQTGWSRQALDKTEG